MPSEVEPARPSALFRGIGDWLLQRALRESDIGETVRGLAHKLLAGGVSVSRINVGGLLLHPVIPGLDITWDAATDVCRSGFIPRSASNSPEFQNAPFFQLVKERKKFVRYRLADPENRIYPILETLGKSGITDYVAFFESYGRTRPLDFVGLPAGAEGTTASFSTRRIGGFTDLEISNLRSLAVPFALAVKAATDQSLATTLLETYLGKISGANVLAGLVARGQGRAIDCAIWYSDLRGSTAMAAALDIDSFLGTINEYFDCTAGAVLDHGGEVLKFIGDGLMAIFPFDDDCRPPSDMCHAALMTAREARARADRINAGRAGQGRCPIEFGIGLHAGSVIYGNVGIERRLDLTVIGPAVNEAARLESLCKRLAVPIITSQKFRSLGVEDLVPLGRHDLPGIEGGLDAFTLPELASAPSKAIGS